MKVLDDKQALALAFISAANRGGCRPTVGDLEEWLRQPATRTRLTVFEAAIAQLGSSLTVNLGAKTESNTDSLIRLRWVEVDPYGQLSLTRLGSALLRSSEMSEDAPDAVTSVVLGADDALAYPRLIHRLAQAVDGALIDPYLRLDQLVSVVTHTSINRFLISEALPTADRSSIAVFVESRRGSAIEVRVAKRQVLHDRLVVCEDFVDTIGTSLNAVGVNHPTVLTPLPAEAADSMRKYFDGWWSAAEVLALSPSVNVSAAVETDSESQ